MTPKQIKVVKETLYVKWDDESESNINIKYLRDQCPCAGCQGETILLKTYRPAKPETNKPGRYNIANIQQVGTYAVQIAFKDGHNTGIYTYDYLKKLGDDEGKGETHKYEPLL